MNVTELEVWDIEGTPRLVGDRWRHDGKVLAMQTIVHQGRAVTFTASSEPAVQWWDLRSGRRMGHVTFHDPVTCLTVNEPNGNLYCAAGMRLYVWPLERVFRGAGGPLVKLKMSSTEFDGVVTALAVHPEGDVVAVALQHTIVVLRDGREAFRIELNSPVSTLTFADRARLVAGSDAGLVTFALSTSSPTPVGPRPPLLAALPA